MTGPVRSRMRPHGDAGITLVETLVAMIVLTLLGAAMAATLAALARTDVNSTSRSYATETDRTIIDAMTPDIEAATTPAGATYSITTATATSLTLYADRTDTNGPEMVAFYTTGGTTGASFHQDTTMASATGTYAATPTTTKIEAYDITTTNPIFTYYNAAGQAMTAPVTGTNLALIESVGVSLTAQEAGLSVPVTISSRVFIRDAEYH